MFKPGTILVRNTNTPPSTRLDVGSLVEFVRTDSNKKYAYVKVLRCKHFPDIGFIKHVYILDFRTPRIAKTKELP